MASARIRHFVPVHNRFEADGGRGRQSVDVVNIFIAFELCWFDHSALFDEVFVNDSVLFSRFSICRIGFLVIYQFSGLFKWHPYFYWPLLCAPYFEIWSILWFLNMYDTFFGLKLWLADVANHKHSTVYRENAHLNGLSIEQPIQRAFCVSTQNKLNCHWPNVRGQLTVIWERERESERICSHVHH